MSNEAKVGVGIDTEASSASRVFLKILPPLTEKQGRCLEFILSYFAENRYYPTQREMAGAMGIKSNTAEMYLQPLEQKGYVRRKPRRQRNIRLTRDGLERLRLMGVKAEDLLAVQ